MVTAGAVANVTLRAPMIKPNFLLLFVDDLGYGDPEFTGHPTTQTPFLTSLATSGKILTTWYSACPVCSASRASLMTGRQWPRMGIPGVFNPTTASGLPLNETTLAEQLQGAGYTSAIVGARAPPAARRPPRATCRTPPDLRHRQVASRAARRVPARRPRLRLFPWDPLLG